MEEKEDHKQLKHDEKRDLILSHVFLFSKQNFTIWEKRLMLYIIYDENIQDVAYRIINKEQNNFEQIDTINYILRFADISKDRFDYKRIKTAFVGLANKNFIYNDDNNGNWKQRTFLAFPEFIKFRGQVKFTMQSDVIKIITEVKKGYSKLNFEILISLKSVYSIRFYEMFINKANEGNKKHEIKIEDLKDFLGCKGKYTKINMFEKRVIKPAKKELDEFADQTFEYQLTNEKGESNVRKRDRIIITVKYNSNFKNIKNDELKNKTENLIISKEFRELLEEMGYDNNGINNNIKLFNDIENIFKNDHGEDEYINKIGSHIRTFLNGKNDIKNKKGYIISQFRRFIDNYQVDKTLNKFDYEITDEKGRTFLVNSDGDKPF